LGGAKSITAVDSSPVAIAAALSNMKLNTGALQK
jgi:23S rRNA G2069 N7-methylase RlmK/C1962 C5-methylase RlmI